MSITHRPSSVATVAMLPAEDVIFLTSGTPWRVAWELMMTGPFPTCALLDGANVRHLTVTSMLVQGVRRRASPDAAVQPDDFPKLPVFAADVTIVDAAARVVQMGWELAVVLDRPPLVIAARSVFRALAAPGFLRPCGTSTAAERGLPPAVMAPIEWPPATQRDTTGPPARFDTTATGVPDGYQYLRSS